MRSAGARRGPRPVTAAARADLARHDLLASAVAGRRIAVSAADGAWSYGTRDAIHIRNGADVSVAAEVVVQAALIAAGSLDADLARRLLGRRAARRRYLTLEVVRAVRRIEDVVPPEVMARALSHYAGPVSGGAWNSCHWALEGDAVPEAPTWFGELKWRPRALTGPGGDDSRASAEGEDEDPGGLLDDEQADRSTIMRLLSVNLPSNPLSRELSKLLGGGKSAPGDDGGAELAAAGRRWGKPGRGADRGDGGVDEGRALPGPMATVSYWYHEYDRGRGAYREAWCRVGEYDDGADQNCQSTQVSEDLALRRELARIPSTRVRRRRQEDGDDLGLDALVDDAVQRRLGHGSGGRVYEARRGAPGGLGVLLLLDASGSTGETADDRVVFDAQREVVAQMARELERLGNRTAAYAFSSFGREDVRFLRIKDFEDRFDGAARQRLGALTPSGFTRIGAAIRHGSHVLAARGQTDQRLLFVVGDGLPFDTGYRDRDAREDSRRALEEAVASGIGCACISVGSGTAPEIAEDVWGTVPHRALGTPWELARHVRPLIAEALASAGATRRRI